MREVGLIIAFPLHFAAPVLKVVYDYGTLGNASSMVAYVKDRDSKRHEGKYTYFELSLGTSCKRILGIPFLKFLGSLSSNIPKFVNNRKHFIASVPNRNPRTQRIRPM